MHTANHLTDRLYRLLLYAGAAFFILLACYSFLAGWYLHPQMDGDYPIFQYDNILRTIPVIILLAGGLFHLLRSGIKTTVAVRITLIWQLFAGCAWVLILQAAPRWDQLNCKDAAARLLSGNIEALTAPFSYLSAHPYQLGYTLYSALLQLLFGTGSDLAGGILNAVFYAAGCHAVLKLLMGYTEQRKVILAACFLFITCLQPLFFTSFLYGNLPGFCLAAFSLLFLSKYLKKEKACYGFLSVWLMMLASLLKPNCQIMAMAVAIVLAFSSFRRCSRLLFAILMLILPLKTPDCVKMLVECCIGASFSTDVPMSAYLVMGLQDTGRCSGWFNGYSNATLLEAADNDPEKVALLVRRDLAAALERLLSDPLEALRFFNRKITSQWSETTFGCLQVNRGNLSFSDRPAWVRALITGKGNSILSACVEGWTVMLYGGCGAGMFLLARQKKAIFLPAAAALILAGAFAYHLLFEAKSQYVFMYLPVMIPFAGYSFSRIPLKQKRSM